MNRIKRGFASDNNAGVHPRVIDALRSANQGHAVAYGDDIYTETAVGLFRERFGERAEVFFVFGGTGANVSALAAVTRPFQAVVCAETAHVNVDECGAPERFFFYVWNEQTSEVRLMCSFDTTEEDVSELVSVIKEAVGG